MEAQEEALKRLESIRKQRDEVKEKRFRFLYALYQITESYSQSDQSLPAIISATKLQESDAVKAARYLFDEGLITNRASLQRFYGWFGKIELEGSHLRKWNPNKPIRITHKGIVEVESALDNPEKATEHFPAHIINYTINIETMTGSQLHLRSEPPASVPENKVRILFLSANPKTTQHLQLIRECNDVRDRIVFGECGDQFHFDQRHQVSLSELDKYLLDYKPQVLHFSGHGSEEGVIIFEDSDGYDESASIKALSDLFRIINGDSSLSDPNRIKLVFLSACYSQKQASAIAKHVDCVVGMSTAVTDDAARTFAESFYQAIGYGKSIKTAFDLGVSKLARLSIPEEQTPRLMHHDKVDPSMVFLAAKN